MRTAATRAQLAGKDFISTADWSKDELGLALDVAAELKAAFKVDRAHRLSEEIEERVRSLVPNAITLSHIEPISQPASYDDIKLERW